MPSTLLNTSGTYGYNASHQITSVAVNGTTVLNSTTYEPFGPINGWTLGNGTITARTYDADGKIAQIKCPPKISLFKLSIPDWAPVCRGLFCFTMQQKKVSNS